MKKVEEESIGLVKKKIKNRTLKNVLYKNIKIIMKSKL